MNYKFRPKKIFLGVGSGIFIGAMLFHIFRGYYEYQLFEKQTRQNIIYWKSIVGEQANYPDGWAKLAVNWYRLGEKELANLAIEKASQLDPINDEISSLKEKINKQ